MSEQNPYQAPGESAGRAAGPYTADQLRSNFSLYLILFLGGLGGIIVGAVVAGVGAAMAQRGDGTPIVAMIGGLLLVIGLAALVAGMVFGMILLYRAWAIIQPHGARTTPGKAVGFLFIPFFNFYWMFVAYRGLLLDFTALGARAGIAMQPKVGLATATCVLLLVGMIPIPIVNMLIQLAYTVLFFMVMANIRDCAIAVLEHEPGAGSAAKAG